MPRAVSHYRTHLTGTEILPCWPSQVRQKAQFRDARQHHPVLIDLIETFLPWHQRIQEALRSEQLHNVPEKAYSYLCDRTHLHRHAVPEPVLGQFQFYQRLWGLGRAQ
ncbi:hypothetical protein D9M69_523490 [compost metagenome]